MPTTLAAVVVLALAIVPGALGTYAWRALNGEPWHQKDWEAAIRFVAFSVVGLGIYVLAALWLGMPPAAHVIPASYEPGTLRPDGLGGIFLPYLGHIISSALVGGMAAGAHRMVCRLTGTSPHPGAWDHFLKKSLPLRWAVVTLKSGDVFAGYVRTAEESAPASQRDVILSFPAKYDEGTRSYLVTPYRDLFLPADLIQNIGTIRQPDEMGPAKDINEPLFESRPDERQADSEDTAAPTTLARTIGRDQEGRIQSPAPIGATQNTPAAASVDTAKEVARSSHDSSAG